MTYFIVLYCFLFLQAIYANGIHEQILDKNIHRQNCELCSKIVHEMIRKNPNNSPQQLAYIINQKIDNLGLELLKQNLNLKIYSYEEYENPSYLAFAKIPLWEGKETNPEIPLTIYLYVWPPEHLAKKVSENQETLENDSRKNYYRTNIHGHPLICSFSVLKGSVCQENYVAIPGWAFNVAKKKDEEMFTVGQLSFDDNSNPFVHRVFCKDNGMEPAITLHGYGASSNKVVRETFNLHKKECSYSYILDEDDQLIYQSW